MQSRFFLTIQLLLIGLPIADHLAAAEEIHLPTKQNIASSRHVSLLVAESLPEARVADPQVLACYTFANGQFMHREEILTAPNKMLRFDLGDSRIAFNRYVITHWGDVVEIGKKAVLHESNGEEFVAVEDQLLVLYRSNDDSFYSYNLRTQQHAKLVPPGKWALLRKSFLGLSEMNVLAPDGTKAVVEGVPSLSPTTNRMTGVGGTLFCCTLDGETKKLGDGFQSQLAPISSSMGTVPLLWLDNKRVLTQKSNGKLVSLRMDGSVEPMVNIDLPQLPVAPPSLSRDQDGRIIYKCGDAYVIDVDRKQFANLVRVKCGHDFEMEPDKWPPVATGIYYQGEEIARGIFDGKTAKTIAGYLASAPFHRSENGSPLHVQVWNAETKTWLLLPLGGHLIKIIGWAELPQK